MINFAAINQFKMKKYIFVIALGLLFPFLLQAQALQPEYDLLTSAS